MTDTNQKQLGNTLRGAMDANDFRDSMLFFLFLRYLSGCNESNSFRSIES